MNICPNCGSINRAGVLICNQCGVSMVDNRFGCTRVDARVDDPPEKTSLQHRTGELVRDRQVVLQVTGGASIQPELDGVMILGRSNIHSPQHPDIDLSRFQAFQLGVSCRHAMMICEDGQLLLADLGSTNGTYLNAERLIPHQAYPVKHGDELRLGHLVLKLWFVDEIDTVDNA